MFDFNATLIVAMISFVVFMFIMNAIFYRPILEIIRKRDDMVANNYNEAKNLADKAKANNEQYQNELNEAKEQSRNQLVKEFDLEQKRSFEKTNAAKEQAKIQMQSNKNLIEEEKTKLYEEVNSHLIDDISSQIFNKIVG